jgi:hypothetical protein
MKALKFSIIAFIATLSFNAFAGPNDGGGGQGWVCRDAHRKITRPVELLDIWEAREYHHREIKYSDTDVREQVDEALKRLKYVVNYPWEAKRHEGSNVRIIPAAENFLESLGYKVAPFFQQTASVERYHNKRLRKTHDAYEDMTPEEEGCELEQIVRYKDLGLYGGSLAMVNQDLIDHMDKTNQAALWVHEALYAILRQDFGEKTSLRVRRAIGYVFAGLSFEPATKYLSNPYISCEAEGGVYGRGKTKIALTAVRMNDKNYVGYMPLQVNGMLLTGFVEPKAWGFMEGSVQEVYKDLLAGRYGFGHGGGNFSPTDFDFMMDFTLTTKPGSKVVTAEVQIENSASGVTMDKPQALHCTLVKK